LSSNDCTNIITLVENFIFSPSINFDGL